MNEPLVISPKLQRLLQRYSDEDLTREIKRRAQEMESVSHELLVLVQEYTKRNKGREP